MYRKMYSTKPSELAGLFQQPVNGVWNTEPQAMLATGALQKTIGAEYNGQPVAYETFYNKSGNIDGSGATGLQDIAEVFIQRAEEIEPDLGEHFEIFWSAVSGDADGFLEKVTNILAAEAQLAVGLLSDLYTEISTEGAAAISNILSNPPTAEDYERHNTRIETLALQGNMLLLVAHSQGNLFVNNAYNSAINIGSFNTSNIGVVHIAPAASITNGPHVLADIDLVINGLRAFGLNTIPSITVDLPTTHLSVDPSGHQLTPTYLNTTLATYGQVQGSLNAEMARLVPAVAEAASGSFTATLTWNGVGDVDLHAFEPDGTQVYYGNRSGSVGFLDVDNTRANGPEHYFASCDSAILQSGSYQIGVNNFSRAEGRTATLQIATPYVADLFTTSILLGTADGSSGDSNPNILVTVDVSVNNDGNIEISTD
ncbi:MAG: hypothetical protein V3V22_09215 [Methylococcales bacterium]